MKKNIKQGLQNRTTWTEMELKTLEENFSNYKTKSDLMALIPDKSWNAILNMARKQLKLKKTNRWETQNKRDLLIAEYLNKNNVNVKDAAIKFGITENLIYKKLKTLNIEAKGKIPTNNLYKILEDNPVSGYWLGLVLADGSFIKHKGCSYLSFWLSKKDSWHVQQFAQFIGISNIREQLKTNSIGFTAHDIKTVKNIFETIGINQNIPKTYCPPTNLKKLSKKVLFSLIVGYIDGDGCIHNIKVKNGEKQKMTVLAHLSWQEVCCFFDSFLYSYFKINKKTKTNPTINSRGYSLWTIRDMDILRKIKLEALNLELPIMNRKWDKIIV
jgi:hypothetical protein